MRLLIPIFLYLIVIDYTNGSELEINWTTKMKRDLLSIYYTNFPNKPGHEKRMKTKWDKKYPQHNGISGEELRQYAVNLIEMISHEEEDGGGIYPWTSKLNRELLKIYHQTRPHWKSHEKRMREVWNKKFPELNAESNNLYIRLHTSHLLRRINEHNKNKKQSFNWLPDIDNEILKIHHEIPENELKRSKKMVEAFHLKYPQFKDEVTEDSLRLHATRLIRRKQEYGEKRAYKSRIDWDGEKNAEVIHIYHQTQPKSFLHENRMQLCWNQMHPELKHSTPERLRRHVKDLLSRGYKPSAKNIEKAKKKFEAAFPDGFKYKGKKILNHADQPSTSYSKRQPEEKISQSHPENPIHLSKTQIEQSHSEYLIHWPEPEINQSHPDKSILVTEVGTSQLYPDTTRQPELRTSQFHPENSIHQPEPHISHFHQDDPIFSPVRHQEFLNDFDMANNIHLPYDFPYLGDYGGNHDHHGNWSQSHNQHNQD